MLDRIKIPAIRREVSVYLDRALEIYRTTGDIMIIFRWSQLTKLIMLGCLSPGTHLLQPFLLVWYRA